MVSNVTAQKDTLELDVKQVGDSMAPSILRRIHFQPHLSSPVWPTIHLGQRQSFVFGLVRTVKLLKTEKKGCFSNLSGLV